MGLRLTYLNFQGSDLVNELNQFFYGFERNEGYGTFWFIRKLSLEISFFRQALRMKGFEVCLEVVIEILKQ